MPLWSINIYALFMIHNNTEKCLNNKLSMRLYVIKVYPRLVSQGISSAVLLSANKSQQNMQGKKEKKFWGIIH